ncbi:hypothetical protein ES705_31297 [subsurface metagenome]
MMKYRYIIGHEWGVGDLLFTDSKGKYLVMEVKELSSSSRRNQCAKRRKTRRKVEKQTQYYMFILSNKKP